MTFTIISWKAIPLAVVAEDHAVNAIAMNKLPKGYVVASNVGETITIAMTDFLLMF